MKLFNEFLHPPFYFTTTFFPFTIYVPGSACLSDELNCLWPCTSKMRTSASWFTCKPCTPTVTEGPAMVWGASSAAKSKVPKG